MPPLSVEPPALLTVAEVAATLKISIRTTFRLIKSGDLHAIRITPRARRIRPADLAAFLTASNKTEYERTSDATAEATRHRAVAIAQFAAMKHNDFCHCTPGITHHTADHYSTGGNS